MVSGASYGSAIAPNSWAVILGTDLAQTTALATLDDSGQWPKVLANTAVQINGQDARLYYVSSGQINVLVPDGTVFGSVPVTITNTANGSVRNGSAQVQNVAPAIFTSNASGSGPGAILNGVTFSAPPFLVETPENGGSDLRTRLAIFATGVRYAGNPTHDSSMTDVSANVTAVGQDASNHQYTFPVEYAGPSGYFGLDQINIVLPPTLDGAGSVSVYLTAAGFASNTVTFQMGSLPASSIRLTGISLSSAVITGGNSVTGTALLNGVARSIGFPITLRSSNPTVQVPQSLTVPAGQVSTTFTVSTPTVASVQNVTITGTGGGSTQSATLEVDPVTQVHLASFVLSASSVAGGTSLTATLGLSGSATVGGVVVQMASDNPAVKPPATITVPFGSTSASATIATSAVTSPQSANLTATLGSTTLSSPLSILPPFQFTLSSDTVTGGGAVTGTITVAQAAPSGGATITLQSNNPAAALPPNTVTVAAGQTTTTFTITTSAVTAARTVTITATYIGSGLSGSATLTVNPPSTPQLSSVSVNPSQVNGGQSATGTVTLSGPATGNGTLVSLGSSSLFAAQVPSLITMPQGQSTANFTITTSQVPSSVTVTITATSGGVSKTTTLTVK